MAYLKFSRDKRGYENFCLVQPTNRGKARPRVLYWFRTPPGVKVGRSPFDPEMRRAIEAQNPDVVFDWEAITQTPIPPPVEPERWRERRRVERAFRAASEIEESVSAAAAGEHPLQPEIELTIAEPAEDSPPLEVEELRATAESDPATEPIVIATLTSPAAAAQGDAARQGGRRRRRRRGRRKPQVSGSGVQAQGSEVPGLEAQSAESQEPGVQNSGEPEDENHEP